MMAGCRSRANEMNLSETAFLQAATSTAPGEDGYNLRWFTPKAEVDLCGHATLGQHAHILWEGAAICPSRAEPRFHTRSGLPDCPSARGDWIENGFPAKLEEPAAALPRV